MNPTPFLFFCEGAKKAGGRKMKENIQNGNKGARTNKTKKAYQKVGYARIIYEIDPAKDPEAFLYKGKWVQEYRTGVYWYPGEQRYSTDDTHYSFENLKEIEEFYKDTMNVEVVEILFRVRGGENHA